MVASPYLIQYCMCGLARGLVQEIRHPTILLDQLAWISLQYINTHHINDWYTHAVYPLMEVIDCHHYNSETVLGG